MDFIDFLGNLEALQGALKDLHYGVRGNEFYGLHKMADELYEPIDDLSDRLKESVWGWNGVPRSHKFKEVSLKTLGVAPIANNDDYIDRVDRINDYLLECLKILVEGQNEGVLNVLGDIGEYLKKVEFFCGASLMRYRG